VRSSQAKFNGLPLRSQTRTPDLKRERKKAPFNPSAARIGSTKYYESVVAFHATRSPSPEDFLKYGIKLSDKKALQEFARNFFGNSDALEKIIVMLRAKGLKFPREGGQGRKLFVVVSFA
jgi:hypothetical protein